MENSTILIIIVLIILVIVLFSTIIYFMYNKSKEIVTKTTPSVSVAGVNTSSNATYLSDPVQQLYRYNVQYGRGGGGGGSSGGGGGGGGGGNVPASTDKPPINASFSVLFPSINLQYLDSNFVANYNNTIATVSGTNLKGVVTSPAVSGANNSGVLLTTTVTDPSVDQVTNINNLYTALQSPSATFSQLLGGTSSGQATPQVTYISGIGPNSSTNVNFTVTFNGLTLQGLSPQFLVDYNAIISNVGLVNSSAVTTALSAGSVIATTAVSINKNTISGTNPSITKSYSALMNALNTPLSTFSPLFKYTGASSSPPVITNITTALGTIDTTPAPSTPDVTLVPQSAIIDETPISTTPTASVPTSGITSPVPTSASTLTIGKKGFVAGSGDPTAGVKITHLNATWYYTWGALPPALIGQPANIKFTPMIWNIAKISTNTDKVAGAQAVVASLSSNPLITNATTENVILGYNEPDGIHASAQANMLVGDAVSFWANIVNAKVAQYTTTPPRLGSPVMYGDCVTPNTSVPGTAGTANQNNMPQPTTAQLQPFPAGSSAGTYRVNISNTSTTNNVDLNPKIWLDNFLIQLAFDFKTNPSKYTRPPFPDFICIHWYGKPVTATFTGYLQKVNAKYNLPIWVTEYSCADWNATCCPTAHPTASSIDWSYPTDGTAGTSTNPFSTPTNQTALFMQQTVQWMNAQPYVERYSWKERYLLVPSTFSTVPNPITTAQDPYCPVAGCPTDSSSSIISASNPDYMNQSALFHSYQHFPTTIPPLTPLGKLYASL